MEGKLIFDIKRELEEVRAYKELWESKYEVARVGFNYEFIEECLKNVKLFEGVEKLLSRAIDMMDGNTTI